MRQTRTQRTAWYRTAVDHTKLKLLAQTDNTTGLLYLSGFVLMLSVFGFLAFLNIGTLWVIPAFLAYGGMWCLRPLLPMKLVTAQLFGAGG